LEITLISTDTDVWAFGLRSIAATLKSAGRQVRLVFMPTGQALFSEGDLAALMELVRQSDLVGFSCLGRGAAKARQAIEALRAAGKRTIWGGVHASLNPKVCAACAEIVCVGEGEELILELAERLEQGLDWKDLQNVAYIDDGRYHQNDLRPPIPNLDDLPLPDFSFEDEHHLTEEGFVRVSNAAEMGNDGRIIFNSSRGCAFHCTYCCNGSLKSLYTGKGHYVRRMSVAKLIEHSLAMKQIFTTGRSFYFIDEDFGLRPVAELAQFAEEFPRQVGMSFECMAHPARINRQKMDLLVKAGMFKIRLGFETGSERTKHEIYDRHEPNAVALRAAQIISEYPQVVPTYFFIIGNPYEEKDDLVATARLIAELPVGCYIIIYDLIFFPGSRLYERAIADGLIEGEHDSGAEEDFLTGLHYKRHPWKQKNLYLNGLIYLMEGYCGKRRIGMVPRSMIRLLLQPGQIEFNEKHRGGVHAVLGFKRFSSALRYRGVVFLKWLVRDPEIAHKVFYFLGTKVLHSQR
jgi:radical SAM superfamily enzyme YgiQ (UPF0313 family)